MAIIGIVKAQAINDTSICQGVPQAAFIRHPGGCNRYYVCWNGRPHARECPAGFKFEISGVCDYPQFVNCGKCSPYGTTAIRYPGSCSQYIECRNGTATNSTCKNGLNFDPSTGTCREAHLVDCVEQEPLPPIASKIYYLDQWIKINILLVLSFKFKILLLFLTSSNNND